MRSVRTVVVKAALRSPLCPFLRCVPAAGRRRVTPPPCRCAPPRSPLPFQTIPAAMSALTSAGTQSFRRQIYAANAGNTAPTTHPLSPSNTTLTPVTRTVATVISARWGASALSSSTAPCGHGPTDGFFPLSLSLFLSLSPSLQTRECHRGAAAHVPDVRGCGRPRAVFRPHQRRGGGHFAAARPRRDDPRRQQAADTRGAEARHSGV